MKENIIKKLSDTIKARFEAAGCDWKAHIYDVVVSHQGWRSPPLLHNGKILGFAYSDLMWVNIPLDFEEFVLAYEDYLRVASAGKENHTGRWAAAFGLPNHQASMLFPEGDRGNRYNCLPAIASLAAMNFEGVVSVSDFNRYLVSVSDFEFGIDNGVPSSNYQGTFKKDEPSTVRPSLVFGRRRQVPNTKLAQRLSTLFKALEVSSMSAQERREVKEGLIILIFHDTDALRDEWLVGKKTLFSFPGASLEALEVAKDFMEYLNPVGHLKDQLVPYVLTAKQFSDRFGNNKALNEARVGEIRRELAFLTEEIKKELENI
jgi:hypothetical protein